MINATYVQNGKLVGKSQVAAGVGIFAVLTTRILNAWPDFVVGAAVMHAFEKRGIYVTKSPLAAGALLMSFFATAFTPFCCALFPSTAARSASEGFGAVTRSRRWECGTI